MGRRACAYAADSSTVSGPARHVSCCGAACVLVCRSRVPAYMCVSHAAAAWVRRSQWLSGSSAPHPCPLHPSLVVLAPIPPLLSLPNLSTSVTRRSARGIFCRSKNSMKSSRMAPWIEARCLTVYLGGWKWVQKSGAVEVETGDRFFGGECVGEMGKGKGEWGRKTERAGGWAGGGEKRGRQVGVLRIVSCAWRVKCNAGLLWWISIS